MVPPYGRSHLCDTDHKRCLCQRSPGPELLSDTAWEHQEAGCAHHPAGFRLHETISDEVMVDTLDSGESTLLTLMKRPQLGVTLSKLHRWSLTQYSKCLFVGADTLVLANIDDLSEIELSLAPDPG